MKKTKFKDSAGKRISIGDDLDILATNQYNGTVNIENDIVCLQTAFFNKPLIEHLEATDLIYALIVDKGDVQNTGDDILPF